MLSGLAGRPARQGSVGSLYSSLDLANLACFSFGRVTLRTHPTAANTELACEDPSVTMTFQ